MRERTGGITSPGGFRAGGTHCGVKRAKSDLALVVSEVPAACGATFTQNRVPAAPVVVDREQLSRSQFVRAVVINSGNANACTGERGMEDARTMIRAAARALRIHESEVLVSSTGVIGQFLPMEKIAAGIAALAPQVSKQGGDAAAEAILTTDTFAKQLAVETAVDGVPVTFGGMAKGSGMIAPNMATMLAFLSTDAAIAPDLLQRTLRRAVDRSFNLSLPAIGGTPPYAWRISAGALPTGLSMDNNGTLVGTPTVTGSFDFTVQLTDAAAIEVTRPLRLTVVPAPAIVTTELPGARVRRAYRLAVRRTGGTEPFVWSLAAGTLPAGLALDATSGTIAGTPTATGQAVFTLRVTDASGATASRQLSIEVK